VYTKNQQFIENLCVWCESALDNVSLELENGMFGLLGPNGA